MKLRPVAPDLFSDQKYLYDVLQARMAEPDYNISHTRLPEWDEHIAFIQGDPYRWWDIILSDGKSLFIKVRATQRCGVAYVTKNNEVGIWIAPNHRKQGLASEVLQHYKRATGMWNRPHLLANINPKNEPSQTFFKKHGFRLITQALGTDGMMTYRWDAYTDQHGPSNELSDLKS